MTLSYDNMGFRGRICGNVRGMERGAPVPPADDRKIGSSDIPPMATRIRAARHRLGWSREALAVHSDLSWSAIEQIESGRRINPRPATLTALSKALGVTIDYLLGDSSSPKMLVHRVLVYGDDDGFVKGAVPFLREGIERSDALLAVVAAENIVILKEQLGESAGRVEFVDATDGYSSPLTAITAYRAFMDGALERGAPWARIVGQPGWGTSKDARSWCRYESLFNLAFDSMPATALCLYDTRTVHPTIVSAARRTHPQIVEEGEITDNPMYLDPSDFLLRDLVDENNAGGEPTSTR
ncbi:MAG: hypothetical protein QOC87_68 [Actinomycetota bacterium]|jgi:transcriptional regulator with XRE-family HTH domain|nr:hypothetical protein [Actinomycetota bacterium]